MRGVFGLTLLLGGVYLGWLILGGLPLPWEAHK